MGNYRLLNRDFLVKKPEKEEQSSHFPWLFCIFAMVNAEASRVLVP